MKKDFNKKRRVTLDLIRHIHSGQMRMNGKVPTWHHLDRVASLLEFILSTTKEANPKKIEEIILASLGHDALEDTKITRAKLQRYVGQKSLSLIEKMTNTYGDNQSKPYVQQIIASSEEVKLIKLSDLYDNCTSVLFGLFVFDKKWAKNYFLPIVRPMIAALMPIKFRKYPLSAEYLKKLVQSSYTLLLQEINRYQYKDT